MLFSWLLVLLPIPISSLSCYNQNCRGTAIYAHTLIPCDNAANKCSHNSTGYPECVPSSGGVGVSCTGQFTCRVDQSSGEAYCSSRSGSWQCYDQKCNGTNQYQRTQLLCDNRYNYCSRDERGYPVCRYTAWGGNGVTCHSQHCAVDPYTGKAFCQPASRSLYYIWGGVVGGAAVMSAILYMSVKCVRKIDQHGETTCSETEKLVKETTDYKGKYIGNVQSKQSRSRTGKIPDDSEDSTETDHIYVNV